MVVIRGLNQYDGAPAEKELAVLIPPNANVAYRAPLALP
jgi:hypothetical protein